MKQMVFTHAHVLNKRNSPSSRVILLNFGLFLVLFSFHLCLFTERKDFRDWHKLLFESILQTVSNVEMKIASWPKNYLWIFFLFTIVKLFHTRNLSFALCNKKKQLAKIHNIRDLVRYSRVTKISMSLNRLCITNSTVLA